MKKKRPKKRQKRQDFKIKTVNSLQWLLEPLESRFDFQLKKMFGCLAAYLNHRLVLVLADGDEPWNGVLIPTEREYHSEILKRLSNLIPHPVLGKWLYISQTNPEFELISTKIIELIQKNDPRFGVEPKPKKRKKTHPITHQ